MAANSGGQRGKSLVVVPARRRPSDKHRPDAEGTVPGLPIQQGATIGTGTKYRLVLFNVPGTCCRNWPESPPQLCTTKSAKRPSSIRLSVRLCSHPAPQPSFLAHTLTYLLSTSLDSLPSTWPATTATIQQIVAHMPAGLYGSRSLSTLCCRPVGIRETDRPI